MKHIIALLWLLSSSLLAFDMVEVLNDDIILHKTGYFVSDKKLSSQEALELSQTEVLKPLPKGAKSFGFDHREYWFVFQISTPSSKQYFIDSKDYLGNYHDFFVYQNNQLHRYEKSGFYLSLTEKAIQTFSSRFALETQAEHTTYLLKINSIFMRLNAFSLGDEVKIEKDWTLLLITFIVTIALAFAFLIYNSVLYFFTKDRLFLIYVVYMFGFVLVNQLSLGYVPFLLGLDGKTTMIVLIFAMSIYTFGLAFFTIYFLNLHQHYHYSTKLFLLLLVINTFLTPFHIFPDIIPYSQNLWLLTMQIFQSFAIFIGIKRYAEGFKPALYYLIATGGGLFFGFCFTTFIAVEGIYYSIVTLNLPNMGLIWDLVMFSLAIAYRIKILTHDNIEKERLLMLQSRQKSIGELTGNIAHQWRQPLSKMGSLLSMLEAKLKYERIEKSHILETIVQSNHILQYLSQTITTFQELFQNQIHMTTFDAKKEILKCINFLENSLMNNAIKIDFIDECAPTLTGDGKHFFQALLNIILNAKDAIISHSIHQGIITIKLLEDSTHWVVNIYDNGGGITIMPIDKIFDIYETNKEHGTGIGLFITKNIIEAKLGGKIRVSNEKDGAVFTLLFPKSHT